MMKYTTTKLIVWMGILLMLLLAGCSDDDNPVNPPTGEVTISSINPISAAAGESLTISGTGFSSTPSQNIVMFGGNQQAEVTSASSTELTVTVPDGAEDGTISVEVDGNTATSTDAFALAAPIPQIYQDLPSTLITHDETWSNDTTLTGPRFVIPGATLTIGEGITVTFTYHNNVSADVGTIITLPADENNFDESQPSGRLVAVGSADNPIVFTSDREEVASWGGIILAGAASNNTETGQGEIEGLSQGVQYGADIEGGESFIDDDDSGQLSYVRIEYSGYSISEGSELQAITLYSVGSGTQLDHISIYKSVDDGIEFFGGTVDVKYFVVVDAQDDTFDIDQGWQGRGQFWLGVQSDGLPSNRGSESDGCADPADCDGGNGATHPLLYNVTIYGNSTANGEGNVDGLFLRQMLEGEFKNFILANFNKPNGLPIYVEGDGTASNIGSQLTFGGNVSFNNMSDDYSSLPYAIADVGVEVLDPQFNDPANFDFSLKADSPALAGGVAQPDDSFFDQVSYRGAFGTENWAAEGSWVKFQ